MSTTLKLSPDELLTTTRAVRRRLDLDKPVPESLVRECIEIAIQAPSGSNARRWHFVVVGDPTKRARIADLYRRAFDLYRGMPSSAHALARQAEGTADASVMASVTDSAEALAANLHRVPWLVIPCIEGRVAPSGGPLDSLVGASVYGSILPAFWSFMLAARARGLGTAWTTLHLMHEREAADLLGIPYDQVMQVGLTPLAFTRGTDFKPARERHLERALHVDGW
jgi:nitroreductase